MKIDIQTLVYQRWLMCVETPLKVPLTTYLTPTGIVPPYATAEYVTKQIPMGRGRSLQEHTLKITVYSPDERVIQSVFVACGLDSTVPLGFHRAEIGDDTVKAVSQITEAGLPKIELDPPLGGGKCYSRVLIIRIRTGSK
jgi:hypothetical protein